ncbi:MAG: substrate-binding domain-containing protein [Anaerolineae bacterium]
MHWRALRWVFLMLLVTGIAACGGASTPAAAPAAPAAPTAAPAAQAQPTAAPKAAAPTTAPTAAPKAAAPTTAPTAAPKAAAPTTAPTAAAAAAGAKPANPELILATTTSTQDSGLLDVLIPLFQKQTGYNVKTVAVGSGQAMTMGERGEADVLLVHSPDAEKKFMDANNGLNRRLVMHNDFLLIGPPDDPAKVKGTKSIVEALKKVGDAKSLFVSRGDNSGTDALDKKLWGQVGAVPKGQSWYQETGQGMGATLGVADEKGGYTLTDRATYLARKSGMKLVPMVEGDKPLLNIYHVIQVNPNKGKINAEGAQAFSDFMVAPETQKVIGQFGVDKYGQQLFIPDAGKTDDQVGL